MGVIISARHVKQNFAMGYDGFFRLRKNIAAALNKEFGENYAKISSCSSEKQQKENSEKAEYLIKENKLDKDIVDFLYASDCSGKASYMTCKKIFDLIKDMNFSGKSFQYSGRSSDDYENFKNFLQECYTKKKAMTWE